MKRILFHISLVFAGAVLVMTGCEREPKTAPPEILYGQDACDVCKMIISDARFASALVLNDDGVIKKPAFDDIGCMLEARNDAGESALAAYVNDYHDKTWIHAEQAMYVYSNELHTPMAFGVAAFQSQRDAKQLQQEYNGEILNVDQVNERYQAGELSVDPAGNAPADHSSGGGDASAPSTSHTRESVQSKYTTRQCTLEDVDGDVVVALIAPTTPGVGKQPFEVLLLRSSDHDALVALTEGTVSIEPEMPAMGHGSAGNENPESTGNGHYRGMVNFTMPGEWVVHVAIQSRSSTATVDFTFEVTK